MIDTSFNFYSDSKGRDPDSSSLTLRRYHRILWSKPLPCGGVFDLSANRAGAYLHHKSEAGEFLLGSDAITHSYKYHTRKQWLTRQIPAEVNELFETGCTIGAYTLFPNNKINGYHTINQARGVNSLIDDRFDLTLECIRRFYQGEVSPLYDTLWQYRDFFALFNDFAGYVRFFLLDDLVEEDGGIRFYLPFDNFNAPPRFSSVADYLTYKSRVTEFVGQRNERINAYARSITITSGEMQPATFRV